MEKKYIGLAATGLAALVLATSGCGGTKNQHKFNDAVDKIDSILREKSYSPPNLIYDPPKKPKY